MGPGKRKFCPASQVAWQLYMTPGLFFGKKAHLPVGYVGVHCRPHPPSRALLSSAERRSRCTGVCFACPTCPPHCYQALLRSTNCALPSPPALPFAAHVSWAAHPCAEFVPPALPCDAQLTEQLSKRHWAVPTPTPLPSATQCCPALYAVPLGIHAPLAPIVQCEGYSAALHSLFTQPPQETLLRIYMGGALPCGALFRWTGAQSSNARSPRKFYTHSPKNTGGRRVQSTHAWF